MPAYANSLKLYAATCSSERHTPDEVRPKVKVRTTNWPDAERHVKKQGWTLNAKGDGWLCPECSRGD